MVAQKKEAAIAAASYHQDGGGGMRMFNPDPTDTGRNGNRSWLVRNFGPVGLGIQLKRPGMIMEISNVEKGSPAESAGKLEKGQIIESINGVVLKEIDPRIIPGDIITRAEATDGEINLKIKGLGNVLVNIPVMGAYSKTWPVDCPKSDRIVRKLADLLARDPEPKWGPVLFLLSTGEEKGLAVVRKWMEGIETIGGGIWEKGYKGPGLCEYMFNESLQQFYRSAEHGNVAYGNGPPEGDSVTTARQMAWRSRWPWRHSSRMMGNLRDQLVPCCPHRWRHWRNLAPWGSQPDARQATGPVPILSGYKALGDGTLAPV